VEEIGKVMEVFWGGERCGCGRFDLWEKIELNREGTPNAAKAKQKRNQRFCFVRNESTNQVAHPLVKETKLKRDGFGWFSQCNAKRTVKSRTGCWLMPSQLTLWYTETVCLWPWRAGCC
jgi:hypothetical protein